MLEAALARLDVEGLQVSFVNLSLEAAIAEAGVSRASAYRRWPSRSAFLADVLRAAAHPRLEPESEEQLAELLDVVASLRGTAATEQGRRDLVVEALRRASDADIRRLLASQSWRNALVLAATQQSLEEGELRRSVSAALERAEGALTEARAGIYSHLPAIMGYRLVPPLEGDEGLRIMSSAAGVTMRGILLRAHGEAEWLDRRTTMSPFGSSLAAPWSEPELHLVRTFLAHLEPDPSIVWDEARVDGAFTLLAERTAAARRGATAGMPPA